ncbi:hypothetical protein FEV51_08115 [Qipengyuania marisflavi]|uniref:Uncharacterized protein n=2 Tax=Qipengyuania marisflavi TaxID=2486356 RepID=A0A5S3P6A0_9SPHN|nr:hypothetical protein FEV51_08115 [Qipengyuania marisflavi]
MLIDLLNGDQITAVPHATQYCDWLSRLSEGELLKIKDELNGMISCDEVHTSSWMPGSDWTGTPFQPIYEKAARSSFDAARKCFGLMVWQTFMERPDEWSFKKAEQGDRDFSGTVYFRVNAT